MPLPDTLVALHSVEQECHVGPACSADAKCHLAMCRHLSFVDADGEKRTCYPVLAYLDSQPQGANALLKSQALAGPLLQHMGPGASEVHNVRKAFKRRTAADMRQVRRLRLGR